MPTYRAFVGDIHSHCGISYGTGTLEEALTAARAHLDFCSVTGHANWPDMPTDRARYGAIIDYHSEGFERLAAHWDDVCASVEAHSDPGRFVTFHSFEWHNCAAGDHNVYYPAGAGPLFTASDIDHLRAEAARHEALVIPHHIGYGAGFRGIDWCKFEAESSPFLEVYSLHGCSESDTAAYPMLHTMGPRRHAATAEAGYRRGLRFGLVGGTDHHGGYPGSYGDGRMVALAEELTRESLWEAFRARRVYALTGDRIEVGFQVNDAGIGETVATGERRVVRVRVAGSDWIDHVELLKNERRLLLMPGIDPAVAEPGPYWRVRLEWGWSEKDVTTRWEGEVRVRDGELEEVEPCFTGPPVVAPGDVEDDPDLRRNAVLEQSREHVAWLSHTRGNPTMHHRATHAVVLTIAGDARTVLTATINGERVELPLGRLAEGSQALVLGGWLGPAVRFWRAVPESGYRLAFALEDTAAEAVDQYRLRVAQRNGQWAWVTPIWATRR